MRNLPNTATKLVFSVLVFFVLLLTSSVSIVLAASSYVAPTGGTINQQTFLISIYAESAATEPAISAANLKVSYTNNVKVVAINNGEFDSYIQKDDNSATREITINAVNTAGNYKTGKVKVASINFEPLQTIGEVQIVISPNSEVLGAGGEQLLTETIDAVYTLNVAQLASTATTTPTTPTTTEPDGAKATVPSTGFNEIKYYAIISALLIGAGILVAQNRKFI